MLIVCNFDILWINNISTVYFSDWILLEGTQLLQRFVLNLWAEACEVVASTKYFEQTRKYLEQTLRRNQVFKTSAEESVWYKMSQLFCQLDEGYYNYFFLCYKNVSF